MDDDLGIAPYGVTSDAARRAEAKQRERTIDANAKKERETQAAASEPADRSMLADIATTAADAVTGSAIRPLYAGMLGTANLLAGEKQPYKKGWQDVQEFYNSARENVGPIGATAIDVGAAFTPMGPLKAVDTAVDASRASRHALSDALSPKPGYLKGAVRDAAATGAAMNLTQSYMQGETDFKSLLASGAFGAAVGGAMQNLLGNNLLRYSLAKKAPEANAEIMSRLSTTSASRPDLLNPTTMTRAAERGNMLGTTFLTTKIGNAPLYMNWQKMHNLIAEETFGKLDISKINTPEGQMQAQLYTEASNAVSNAITQVNKNADDTFRSIVEPPLSRVNALNKQRTNLGAARQTYARMSNTQPTPEVPDPLGAQSISVDEEILIPLKKRVPAAFGRRTFEEAPAEVKKMYNRFNDLVRSVYEERLAGDFVNVPADERRGATREDIFNKIPLARLMDARRSFADELKPGSAFANGVTATEVKAGMEILNAVDELIDGYTHNAYGLARGTFAKAMRQQEMFDYGRSAYHTRASEMRNQSNFLEFYGQAMDDVMNSLKASDPEALEMFNLGQRQGLYENVNHHGFLVEMTNLLGKNTDFGDAGSFYSTKKGGTDILKRTLGDDADLLTDLMHEGAVMDDAMRSLSDVLRSKGISADATADLIGLAKGSLDAPKEPMGLAKVAAWPLVRRFIKDSDTGIAAEALDMLTMSDKDLADFMKGGALRMSGGAPKMLGARASAIASNPDIPAAEARAEDREKARKDMVKATKETGADYDWLRDMMRQVTK